MATETPERHWPFPSLLTDPFKHGASETPVIVCAITAFALSYLDVPKDDGHCEHDLDNKREIVLEIVEED